MEKCEAGLEWFVLVANPGEGFVAKVLKLRGNCGKICKQDNFMSWFEIPHSAQANNWMT